MREHSRSFVAAKYLFGAVVVLILNGCQDRGKDFTMSPAPVVHQSLTRVLIFKIDGSLDMAKTMIVPVATEYQPVNLDVAIEEKTSLGAFNLINGNCDLVKNFEVVVVDLPKYGAISSNVTEMVATFDASDPRHRCNGNKYQALQMYYKPTA